MKRKTKNSYSRIPIADLTQEAFDKHYCCCKDKVFLTAGGLDWNLVESLPQLATECSKAYTTWQLCKDDIKIAAVELKKLYKQSVKTRARLSKLIRNSELLKKTGRKLPQYCNNRKIADVIQDLHELVYIADGIREHEPGFISKELVNEGKERFESLRKKSIESALLKDDQKKLSHKKNMAAQVLKNKLGSVMVKCRDIFINDPDRASRYTFAYHSNYNRKRLKKNKKSLQKHG
jgi:hypothetical protein